MTGINPFYVDKAYRELDAAHIRSIAERVKGLYKDHKSADMLIRIAERLESVSEIEDK